MTPKVEEFSTDCAEKAAPMFVVRGRPMKASVLASVIQKAVEEISLTTTEAIDNGDILVMKMDVGIGVFVHVDTFFEEG